MIGTVLWARSRLQTSSPSSFGSMMSSTTRSTGLAAEALERLLAVGSLDDRVAVALERKGQHLPHGGLVVDEEDRGGVDHRFRRRRRMCSGSCSYYSPPMAALQPPARRRRRPRRGSLERPVNARLYRASFLVVLAARCCCSLAR